LRFSELEFLRNNNNKKNKNNNQDSIIRPMALHSWRWQEILLVSKVTRTVIGFRLASDMGKGAGGGGFSESKAAGSEICHSVEVKNEFNCTFVFLHANFLMCEFVKKKTPCQFSCNIFMRRA
jgi:hypothetical protein